MIHRTTGHPLIESKINNCRSSFFEAEHNKHNWQDSTDHFSSINSKPFFMPTFTLVKVGGDVIPLISVIYDNLSFAHFPFLVPWAALMMSKT